MSSEKLNELQANVYSVTKLTREIKECIEDNAASYGYLKRDRYGHVNTRWSAGKDIVKKDLTSIKDLTRSDIEELFKLAKSLKVKPLSKHNSLKGKSLALVFQKPSNRTRVSFEVGMFELGGKAVYLGPDEVNLGVRESFKDAAKVLSRYVSAMVVRTFRHEDVLSMAGFSSVPVINGLSDLLHP